MATTRLSQIGIGVRGYPPFAAKGVNHEGLFTRLTAIGVGGARYPGFQAKTAAEPQPEEFVGFPVISPSLVEGNGYGVLPCLVGEGFGVVGVAGRGVGTLPRLHGAGVGQVDDDLTMMMLLLAA